ncbi:MAG: butyrate kinase [Cytophagaceae bacterium]|jgi:butyrate kinase|nr:butyrate kinase [Cytophagaceae bacterium]
MKYKILVINPGSTSTKIAVYEDEQPVFQKTLRHSTAEIEQFPTVPSQYSFRKETILKELADAGISINDLNAVIGRGGVVKPVESGVYEVNDALKNDLNHSRMGQHASNLGGLIADDIARMIPNARAFIADPVVVDELDDVARITGHPLLPHQSIFHALNQKAIARKFAKDTGRRYEDLNLIVAHLGGGISIGAHRKGRIIDVNNALNGYGPFSPERAGTLPAFQLAELCFSGNYTIDEVRAMITGKGGLVAHIGINDVQDACKRANEGDANIARVLKAMAYGIAKAIGSAYAVLKGKTDGILLTGGIAYNDLVVKEIVEHIESFGIVVIYPGEDEMGALAMNALGVLKGEMQCKVY